MKECKLSNKDVNENIGMAKLVDYSPQKSFLALVNTGDNKAISSFKGFALYANSMWTLKDHIDQKFVKMFDVQNKVP
jgi:selenide,water dikinase